MPDDQTLEEIESLLPSDEEVEEAYGYRERYESEDGLETLELDLESILPLEVANLSPELINSYVSSDAHKLVLLYEVAGKSGYERRYKRPIWPRGQSGVTIGIGYDLGYRRKSQVEEAWGPHLAASDLADISKTIGIKGSRAQRHLSGVRHVEVSWDAAYDVYTRTTVFNYGRLTLKTFPGCEKIHPHCFGALFSVIYNRGSSLRGDRRREMKNIRDHILAGRFERVPAEFRAMKRIWKGKGLKGLLKRREAEAKLFEEGLIEREKASKVIPRVSSPGGRYVDGPEDQTVTTISSPAGRYVDAPDPADPGAIAASAAVGWVGNQPTAASKAAPQNLEAMYPETIGDDIEGDGEFWNDEDLYESMAPEDDLNLERASSWGSVSWVNDDALSTEYAHFLPEDRETYRGCSFEFTARDLELLIRCNRFKPITESGRIIFGLRGAMLDGSTASPDDRHFQVDRQALRLKEARPDHKNFRCVIGVFNRETRLLSGFISSTVPNRKAVYSYFKTKKSGNMLPSGCYRYKVGPHSRGRYPGCLREDQKFTVLRSVNDPAYDVKDKFDRGMPMDNIHPAFNDRSAKFSSFGCQVIRGSCKRHTDQHSGEWRRFRQALGLTKPMTGDHGRRFSYVLFTGMDAAIASAMRQDGSDGDYAALVRRLARLRQGSVGNEVRNLQVAMGLDGPDGQLGSFTKLKLTEMQKSHNFVVDGIYSPAMDEALNAFILRPEPTTVATSEIPSSAPVSTDVVNADQPIPVTTLESVGHNAQLERMGYEELDQLYIELARRSRVAERYPEALTARNLEHLESMNRESLASLLFYGKTVFGRIERSIHDLICGDALADADDRGQLIDILNSKKTAGLDQIQDFLTGVLTAKLFLPPPINEIAARIVVQKIIKPSIEDAQSSAHSLVQGACRLWMKRLNETYEDAPDLPGSQAEMS